MTNTKVIWVMATLLFLTTSPALAVVWFADGRIHNIDYEFAEHVRVGSSPRGLQTTVRLLEGGSTGELDAYDNSQIDILGGSIPRLSAFDRTKVSIGGGAITYYLVALDDSRVRISGGSIDTLDVHSQVEISGGTISWHMFAAGTSQVFISGGYIERYLRAEQGSQVEISGGRSESTSTSTITAKQAYPAVR